jgi:hypothetical protein
MVLMYGETSAVYEKKNNSIMQEEINRCLT